jgi:hypothetical protein
MQPERPVPEILADAAANSVTLDVIGGRLWVGGFIAEATHLAAELAIREADITAYIMEHRKPSALDALAKAAESENL